MTEDNVARKQAKQQLKNMRSIERIKKAFYILFVCYVILFIVKYAIKNDPANNRTIYEKVGAGAAVGSLDIRDSLIVKEYTINRYKEYLKNKQYDLAYEMLTKEYQDFVAYSDYVNEVKKIDVDTFDMKELHQKSSLAYVADVVYTTIDGQNVETNYMLYPNEYNPENFKMSPDGFLYVVRNQEFEKDHMIIKLDECLVYNNTIKIKGSITNKEWFNKDIKLANIAVSYGQTLKVWTEFDRTIENGATVPFSETFNKTDYLIPNGIAIEKENKKNNRVYWFEFIEEEKEGEKITLSEIIDTLKS